MTTEENNRLIAEFMELPTEIFKSGILNYGFEEAWYELEELSFDTSWDWLMPVVEKIVNIVQKQEGFFLHNFRIGLTSFNIKIEQERTFYDFEAHYLNYDKTITAVNKVVVEFIKWYNENGAGK